MIPEKIILEGFLSYKSRTEANLSQIKVACVSGANGAGKSTLFDAITWALFGKARRNDDALINNKAERCQVVFEFLYENNHYRVDRAKPRGKGTELEFYVQTEAGAWKPLTEAGVRATEERIRDVLRLDYDTFINASFFLQGKADMFAIQTPARRKEILSSILGLEVWDSYRDEAAKRRRDAQSAYKTQQIYLDDIVKELGEEDERVNHLEQKKALLDGKVELKESSQAQLDQARVLENQLKNEREKLEMLTQQAENLDKNLAENQRILQERQQECVENEKFLSDAKVITDDYNRYQEVREALRRMDTLSSQFHALTLKKKDAVTAIETQKARLKQEQKALAEEAQEITEIQKTIPAQEKAFSEKESEQAMLTAEIEKTSSLEEKSREIKDEQSKLDAENKHLDKEMRTLRKRMDELEAAGGPECPLCRQPLSDAHKHDMLAEMTSDGTTMGDTHRANKAQIEQLESDFQEISAEIRRLNALRPHHNQLVAETAVLKQQIEENKRRIADWNERGKKRFEAVMDQLENGKLVKDQQAILDGLEKQIAGLGYAPESHEELRTQEIAMQGVEEKFRKLESARAAQTGLVREIEERNKQIDQITVDMQAARKLITNSEASIAKQAKTVPDVAMLEERLHLLKKEENELRSDMVLAQQAVAVLEDQRKRKSVVEAEMQEIARQIARLKMLETAFGRDGIPALLIEQAIPQIEVQANDILDKLTNGDMSVNFETEREYADKKREDKKQTLDIMISDSAGMRVYELFSGGEAFRINFAIRLALSRMLAHRSGARLQTLVIDEGFGSQDAEGRQRLVEAINLVSEDFAKILVITHLDELKDAFPSRVEVTKTADGSQVEVIL